MSSWLEVTRKVVASAIASIAAELEQSVVDFNDAVQEMNTSRGSDHNSSQVPLDGRKNEERKIDDGRTEQKRMERGCLRRKEMRLARESQELPKGPTIVEDNPDPQQIPPSTRQASVTPGQGQASHFLHMSTWPTSCLPPAYITTQPRSGSVLDVHPQALLCEYHQTYRCYEDSHTQYERIDSPCTVYAMYTDQGGHRLFSDSSNCHKCRMDVVLRLRLGEKLPGKVIRAQGASSSPLLQREPSPLRNKGDSCFTNSLPDQSIYGNSPDSDYRPLLQSASHPMGEEQRAPRWLGYFTFALAQVTSAVWMMMDEPRRRLPASNNQLISMEMTSQSPRCDKQQQSNVSSAKKRKLEFQNEQHSDLRLEVHKPTLSVLSEHDHLDVNEDRNLLSPCSIQSNHSSESFEVIDTYMAEELPEFVKRSEAYFSGSPTQNMFCPEPFTFTNGKELIASSATEFQKVESSADFINFKFSSLINPQSYGNNVIDIAVSDDGSSSFDVLSEPGEEDLVLF